MRRHCILNVKILVGSYAKRIQYLLKKLKLLGKTKSQGCLGFKDLKAFNKALLAKKNMEETHGESGIFGRPGS